MWRKPWLLWPLLSVPFLYLLYLAVSEQLGADPAKEVVHRSGEYALWLLMLIMLASPVMWIAHRRELMLIRRPLGVACFIYVVLHALLYIATYLEFSSQALSEDLIKRPYIIVGALAFMLAAAMAVTSNSYMVRKLKRRWATLHRSIYVMAMLVSVHIVWQVKFDYSEAVFYSGFFLLMLIVRIPVIKRKLHNM